MNKREAGSLGGRTTLERHGTDHFSDIGRKGFEATVKRWFAGDRKKAVEWLKRRGWYMADRGLPYANPEIFWNPGLHPAHEDLIIWLDHTERNIE